MFAQINDLVVTLFNRRSAKDLHYVMRHGKHVIAQPVTKFGHNIIWIVSHSGIKVMVT